MEFMWVMAIKPLIYTFALFGCAKWYIDRQRRGGQFETEEKA